jgi:hypothetical protein
VDTLLSPVILIITDPIHDSEIHHFIPPAGVTFSVEKIFPGEFIVK